MDGELLWTGSKHLGFRYRDANGATTERNVVAHKLVYSGDYVHLVAHCLDRDEERNFRADRFQSTLLDKETGELAALNEIFPEIACVFERKPASAQTESPTSEKGHQATATKPVRSRKSKKPPFGLPEVKGTNRLGVLDETNYREIVADYFEPRERKNLSPKDVLPLLDCDFLELYLDSFFEFVENELAKDRFPAPLTATVILEADPQQPIEVVVRAGDPCLASRFFSDAGFPTSDHLLSLSKSELQELASRFDLPKNQNKKGLVQALVNGNEDLGLRVCRLDTARAMQAHKELKFPNSTIG